MPNFSDLNSHLFNKGCTISPECQCGYHTEDTNHFLILCPNYQEIRHEMLTKINNLDITQPINTDLLLFGKDLPEMVHNSLQHYLSEMLINSERFLNYQETSNANMD